MTPKSLPFANKQFEWAGTMATGNTQFTQLLFTVSNSDDVFTPTSGGHTPHPMFFIPNTLPFHNNTAYNHIPDNFHTPTTQFPCHFICDTTPHLPSPPPLPPHIHPSNLPCIHTPILHQGHPPQTTAPNFPHFSPGLMHQYPPYFQSQHPVPIQYVYLPSPLHPTVPDTTILPSASKSLPVITSIPILNLKTDFYAWDEGISTLLWHLGIHGHILDPANIVDAQCLDLSSSRRPTLSEPPTPLKLVAFKWWNDNDNITQHVLIGRLGSLAQQLLPSMDDHTAFVIYKAICKYFRL